jgi:hypothetical protein
MINGTLWDTGVTRKPMFTRQKNIVLYFMIQECHFKNKSKNVSAMEMDFFLDTTGNSIKDK